MSDRVRCACRQCTIRGLMGPAIIITVGVLFLLDQMSSGNFLARMGPRILQTRIERGWRVAQAFERHRAGNVGNVRQAFCA